MYYIGLVIEYLKNYMKTRLTYRADFWVEVISDLLLQVSNLIFIFVVFGHTDTLGGWSEAEVVFVYGFFMVPFGLFSCFVNLWNFSDRYIVKGEMDRILTRPAYNLFQIFLENIDPPGLIGSVIGLVIMVISGGQLGLELLWWHIPVQFQTKLVIMVISGGQLGLELLWWHIPVLLLFALSATLIYTGIYITLTSLSFYSDSPTGIIPLLYNIQNYGRYPVTIYNRAIQFLLTWILPFAFVGIYPASLFLGRTEMTHMAWLTPVMAAIFLTIGLTSWNLGVKKYRGAGS